MIYAVTFDSTPLHLSVVYNDFQRARFLLEHGANIAATSDFRGGRTPLALARQLQNALPAEERGRLIELLSQASQKNAR
ncbi:hypothetical protein [Alkalilimnicola sp. S0819]|uniref:hypothetical protein n=1 Tax=Alkalilimnicola sp. S0819 TaxID=2613922 RepID=UPI001261C6BA|nr:hypothetical protein [Alkalilimnicola sp. S0819]KAB7627280.1 hypothetical protein F3N43_05030 [Alkalilimnicola sp. S0819]MPQ15993.1 hypothetical protein [Alkalilimnicola sp. S0819]